VRRSNDRVLAFGASLASERLSGLRELAELVRQSDDKSVLPAPLVTWDKGPMGVDSWVRYKASV